MPPQFLAISNSMSLRIKKKKKRFFQSKIPQRLPDLTKITRHYRLPMTRMAGIFVDYGTVRQFWGLPTSKNSSFKLGSLFPRSHACDVFIPEESHAPPKRCSCRSASYCDVLCQKQMWASHQAVWTVRLTKNQQGGNEPGTVFHPWIRNIHEGKERGTFPFGRWIREPGKAWERKTEKGVDTIAEDDVKC